MPIIDDLGISKRKTNQVAGIDFSKSAFVGPPAPQPEQPGLLSRAASAIAGSTETGGFLSPENIGSFAGGMAAGALAGGPAGAVAYPIIGAALGGAAGNQLERLDPRNPPRQDSTLAQIGDAATRQGIGQAVGDFVGGLASKAIRGIGSGLVSAGDPMISSQALQRVRVQDIAAREGIPLTASQQTGSSALAQLESVPARFALGVTPATEFADRQTSTITNRLSEFGGQQSLEGAGLAARSAKESALTTAKNNAKSLYDRVAALVPPDQEFALNNVNAAAKEIMNEQILLGRLANKGANAAETIFENTKPVREEYTGNLTLPQQLIDQLGLNRERPVLGTYEEIAALRTRLGQLYESAPTRGDQRFFAKLLEAVDADLGEGLRTIPGAADALSTARGNYKTDVVERFFDNEATKRIDVADPSELVHKLIPPKASVEDIRRAKAVIDPQTWKTVRETWISDILKNVATDPQTLSGTTPGQAAVTLQRLATFFKTQNYSPDVLDEIFDGKGQRFSELLDVLRAVTGSRLLGSNSSETARGILGASQVFAGGSLFLQVLESALSGTPPSPAKVSSALSVLVMPEFLAKALLTPGGIELMTRGLKIDPAKQTAAQEASQIASQLLARMGVTASRTDTGDQRSLEDLLTPPQTPQQPLQRLLPNGDRPLRGREGFGSLGFRY